MIYWIIGYLTGAAIVTRFLWYYISYNPMGMLPIVILWPLYAIWNIGLFLYGYFFRK